MTLIAVTFRNIFEIKPIYYQPINAKHAVKQTLANSIISNQIIGAGFTLVVFKNTHKNFRQTKLNKPDFHKCQMDISYFAKTEKTIKHALFQTVFV